ncbi:MAG: hypothetical protein JW892_10425 [Anaerolineae bacterium]|nr:hypothetical protein [Anaerolineae bacterium]
MESTFDAATSLLWWLNSVGLHFDPFDTLNAADDPHLSEYLVEHEIFARLWGNDLAWVFAPPGGGKTALRCRVTQACWIGQETNRPFPLPYLPPFLSWGSVAPTLEDHLAALAQVTARALLLALAYRPHWTLRLSAPARQEVHHALVMSLPGTLKNYLDLCRQTTDLQLLRRVLDLDHAFALPNPPEREQLLAWCDGWGDLSVMAEHSAPQARWEALHFVLLDILQFENLYVLLDGLDAAPETSAAPEAVVDVLAPLLEQAAGWRQQNVYLKGFLPLDTQTPLGARFPQLFSSQQTSVLKWTVPLLAEVTRRRVDAASKGAFDSLDAIASPALRDLEAWLAAEALPMPRELLVLTRRVLQEHVTTADSIGLLQEVDVQRALRWYQAQRPKITLLDDRI